MKETIEEATKRVLANNIDGLRDALHDDLFFFYKDVIQCYGEEMAKWQAERMYSEEDMRKAILFGLDGMYGFRWGKTGQIDIQIERFLKKLKQTKIYERI